MIVFIDESGDAGFQVEKGSSPNFIVVMVIFADELDAEEASLKIRKLRKKMGKSENFEFKFNKLNKEFRTDFLNEVKNMNFLVRAIVFQKKHIYSLNLRSSKEKFYNYAVKCLLQHNQSRISHAKIRIDASSDKKFKQELGIYLRKELNNNNLKIMKNLKFKDSAKDVLIQLADMIAGSIGRSYQVDKVDSQEYIRLIKKRIDDIWEFK